MKARIGLYHDRFYLDILKRVEVRTPLRALGNYIAGIDLNVNNLLAIVSTNPELPSILIGGGELKAQNQLVEKKKTRTPQLLVRHYQWTNYC